MVVEGAGRFKAFACPPEAPRVIINDMKKWTGLVPHRKIVRRSLLAAAAVLGGVLTGWLLTHFQDMPEVRKLETFRAAESSRVYAGDGSLIYDFAEQHRILLSYGDIPPFFLDALIATEDSRFYDHWGVDIIGIARALVRNVMAGGVVQGGSSLTQQLAKVLFLTPERTISRKVKEAVLTLQIEMRYSKQRILELYTNQIYLGHGVYGLEAAADYYFGRHAGELSSAELAMLVGLIKNPGRYDPLRYPDRAYQRMETVLNRMVAEGRIDQPEAECIAWEPIVLRDTPRVKGGEAPLGSYFVEEAGKVLRRRYSSAMLYGGGLEVRTTLDPEIQKWAEEALDDGLRRLDKQKTRYRGPAARVPDADAYYDVSWGREIEEGAVARAVVKGITPAKAVLRIASRQAELTPSGASWARLKDFSKTFRRGDVIEVRIEKLDKDGNITKVSLEQPPELQGAVLALRPSTGAVVAMVGGYSFSESKFNRAVQARRQPGSAIKPFIYAAAFERGFTPADAVMDEPTVFFDAASGYPYLPENYEHDHEGLVTLRHALQKSRNVPTVRLLNRIGIAAAVEETRRFGFKGHVSPYLSMALGANEVTLEELVSAYSALANGGVRARPYFLESVKSASAGTLEAHEPVFEPVMNPEAAYVLAQVLRGVIQRGTAARYAGLPGDVCGKTGTTNDYTDAWFVGFAPDLALGVWVGYDKKVSMGPGMVGATAALPIWAEVMQRYLQKFEAPPQMPRPERVVKIAVDRKTGLRATLSSSCPDEDIIFESFIEGTEPAGSCSEAAHQFLTLEWRRQQALMASSESLFPRVVRSPAVESLPGERLLDMLSGGGRKLRADARKDAARAALLLRSGVPLGAEAVRW
jgi:penicillin-binding protein 1A